MFKPKGEKAAWEMIYEHIQSCEPGEIITLEELSEMIDGDITKYRQAVYKARKVLAEEKKKYLVSKKGVGYEVVEGKRQLSHAEKRHDAANKQIKLANFEAININVKSMSLEERERWDRFLAYNGTLLNFFSQKASNMAKANVVATMANEAMSDQLNEMKEQLDHYASQLAGIQDKIKER